MKIIPYGGAGEIGGNKILLETGRTRVFLDFGVPFDRGEGIYSGFDYLDPRDKLGLRDYFEFDMVPQIPGVYCGEALKYTKLKYTAPKFDAILISHIHCDHFGDVADVDPKIPVYLGHGARKLNDAFNTIYSSFKSEDNGNVVEFKSGKSFKIKDIEVMPVHTDHSIPGAYGFIIKTPEGNIAYTGDYRFHGFKPEMTQDFIDEAKKTGIDYLITEGTRIKASTDVDFRKKMNEADVENQFLDTIKKSRGITCMQFSFRNVDRVRSLYNAAKKAGKVLICNPGFAYTIDNARELVSGLPETLNNPNLKIFNKNADIPDDEKRHLHYAAPYEEKTVDYKWVKKNLNDVVMFMSASELSQLIDIQPGKGTFVYSMSEHYIEGEEHEDYKACLENWLNHFGLNFAQIHCSGHTDAQGVKRMIDGVAPKCVIPVHTQNPEEFKKMHGNVILMERGKEIKL
jgi:ribonuclease J